MDHFSSQICISHPAGQGKLSDTEDRAGDEVREKITADDRIRRISPAHAAKFFLFKLIVVGSNVL